MKIFQESLSEELKKTIHSGFKKHAIQEMGREGIGDSIAFVATENDVYIGAVVVQPFWGALHVKNLWVRADQRGLSIGKTLLENALKYGQEAQYTFAFVETLSFQALEFYQKMGFTLEFTRTGYSEGISFHYLRKELSSSF